MEEMQVTGRWQKEGPLTVRLQFLPIYEPATVGEVVLWYLRKQTLLPCLSKWQRETKPLRKSSFP
jgi:hypothetical protein